jgi:hypothetical protein
MYIVSEVAMYFARRIFMSFLLVISVIFLSLTLVVIVACIESYYNLTPLETEDIFLSSIYIMLSVIICSTSFYYWYNLFKRRMISRFAFIMLQIFLLLTGVLFFIIATLVGVSYPKGEYILDFLGIIFYVLTFSYFFWFVVLLFSKIRCATLYSPPEQLLNHKNE